MNHQQSLSNNLKKSRFAAWLTLRHISQSNKESLRNPWFLGLLGIVAIFFAVNIVFIIFAITSNPGLVVDDYYEKGRDYEKNVITRLAARDRLHWQTKLEIPGVVYTHSSDIFRFSAVDSRGVSIDDAAVKIIAYRPSNAGADFTQTLDQIAPGLYQSKLQFPLPGVWDINVKVVLGADIFYQKQRIHVHTAAE